MQNQDKISPQGKLKRMATMAARIKADYPEFVRMFDSADLANYGMYIRIRSVQMHGKCGDVEISKEEMHSILALCASETVKNKAAYLGTMISRLKIEQTLASIRAKREMRTSPIAYAFAKYVAKITAWQLKTAFGLARGKYSMDDVVSMCELCAKKEKPASYLLGILKKGYQRYDGKNRSTRHQHATR